MCDRHPSSPTIFARNESCLFEVLNTCTCVYVHVYMHVYLSVSYFKVKEALVPSKAAMLPISGFASP